MTQVKLNREKIIDFLVEHSLEDLTTKRALLVEQAGDSELMDASTQILEASVLDFSSGQPGGKTYQYLELDAFADSVEPDVLKAMVNPSISVKSSSEYKQAVVKLCKHNFVVADSWGTKDPWMFCECKGGNLTGVYLANGFVERTASATKQALDVAKGAATGAAGVVVASALAGIAAGATGGAAATALAATPLGWALAIGAASAAAGKWAWMEGQKQEEVGKKIAMALDIMKEAGYDKGQWLTWQNRVYDKAEQAKDKQQLVQMMKAAMGEKAPAAAPAATAIAATTPAAPGAVGSPGSQPKSATKKVTPGARRWQGQVMMLQGKLNDFASILKIPGLKPNRRAPKEGAGYGATGVDGYFGPDTYGLAKKILGSVPELRSLAIAKKNVAKIDKMLSDKYEKEQTASKVGAEAAPEQTGTRVPGSNITATSTEVKESKDIFSSLRGHKQKANNETFDKLVKGLF
jgi:hypothetical protein